jgi:hypothetical protein
MSQTSKQVIAVIATVAILAAAWWGSYAPMRKAEIYIATLQGLQQNPATSLQDLTTRLGSPLDYPSPIGQEELVRNAANNILSFVQQSNDATTTAALISFLRTYFDPIIAGGKGMSFGQDLYIMGAIEETAFARGGNPQYLAEAQKYYEEANQLGPDRPQSLYGLFDAYRFEGNVASTTAVANKVLSLWPTDQNIRQGLAAFLSQVQAQSKAKPTSTK